MRALNPPRLMQANTCAGVDVPEIIDSKFVGTGNPVDMLDDREQISRQIIELARKYKTDRPCVFLLMLAVGWCQHQGFGDAKILATVRYCLRLNWTDFRRAILEASKEVKKRGRNGKAP